jgi:hypothetical protein
MTFEDPVTTIVQLLKDNMHVVKDDESLAKIYVSKEWYDQALFKNYDGQVTVGLEHSLDQKLELSGAARRRLGFVKVNAWSYSRDIREKLREEINRIIRENRNNPSENGISYCDVASFRDLDQVRLKPFLWRTEFMVKTWLFENVLGG